MRQSRAAHGKIRTDQSHDGQLVQQLETVPGRKSLAVPILAIEEHLLLMDARRDGRQGGSEELLGHGHPVRMPHQWPVDPGASDLRIGFDPQDADDLLVLDRQMEAFLDRQRQLV